jgi:hypothetical protein
MLVEQVQLIILANFKDFGSNLHAPRVALATVVIDNNFRMRISGMALARF